MGILYLPKVILMDEPCNGFDPISRKNFYYYLSTLKDKTIVLTTQRIDEAEKRRK